MRMKMKTKMRMRIRMGMRMKMRMRKMRNNITGYCSVSTRETHRSDFGAPKGAGGSTAPRRTSVFPMEN